MQVMIKKKQKTLNQIQSGPQAGDLGQSSQDPFNGVINSVENLKEPLENTNLEQTDIEGNSIQHEKYVWKCNFCDVTFMNPAILEQHMNIIHTTQNNIGAARESVFKRYL